MTSSPAVDEHGDTPPAVDSHQLPASLTHRNPKPAAAVHWPLTPDARVTSSAPTGGWKSGYKYQQLPPKPVPEPVPVNNWQQGHQYSSSLQQLAVDLDGRLQITPDTTSSDTRQVPRCDTATTTLSTCSSSSLMRTTKPHLQDGVSTKEQVDLADFVDGTLPLVLGQEEYVVDACVTETDYGFALKARRKVIHARGHTDKPVFIKMVSRESEAYRHIGRWMHPAHTELALMRAQSRRRSSSVAATTTTASTDKPLVVLDVKIPPRAGRHLPEFIEHYWLDAAAVDLATMAHSGAASMHRPRCSYLAIVTKTHGVKVSGWQRLRRPSVKYRDVGYFQQAA